MLTLRRRNSGRGEGRDIDVACLDLSGASTASYARVNPTGYLLAEDRKVFDEGSISEIRDRW
jgi:hypothetical protein